MITHAHDVFKTITVKFNFFTENYKIDFIWREMKL